MAQTHPPFPARMSILLDNPIRAIVQNRGKILREAGVREGMTLVDFGCGPGFFTVKGAEVVGDEGMVFAFDVQEEMIARVKRKMERVGVRNVVAEVVQTGSLPVGDGSVDLVFLYGVYPEIDDQEGALSEFRRILKPGGTLVLHELKFEVGKKEKEERIHEVEAKGFDLLEEKDTFFTHMLRFGRK